MVVFLGAIILAAGVYFLEARSEADLESQKQELADLKETFSTSDIERLRELDRRIHTAERLLSRHLSPTRVFDMLERRTQNAVQFRNFSYIRNESGTAALSLEGTAPRFNTVALQSEGFSEDSTLSRAIFSGLNIVFEEQEEDESVESSVNFAVTGLIDTETIAFSPNATESGDTATEDEGTTQTQEEDGNEGDEEGSADNATSTQETQDNNDDQ